MTLLEDPFPRKHRTFPCHLVRPPTFLFIICRRHLTLEAKQLDGEADNLLPSMSRSIRAASSFSKILWDGASEKNKTFELVRERGFMGSMALIIMQFLWHCIPRSSYGTAYHAVPMALHITQFLWHCIWRSSYGTAYHAVPMALHTTQFLWHWIPRSSYGTAYHAVPMVVSGCTQ